MLSGIICTIWKNMKSTHGGVSLLVKVLLTLGWFSRFLNCTIGSKLRKASLSKVLIIERGEFLDKWIESLIKAHKITINMKSFRYNVINKINVSSFYALKICPNTQRLRKPLHALFRQSYFLLNNCLPKGWQMFKDLHPKLYSQFEESC